MIEVNSFELNLYMIPFMTTKMYQKPLKIGSYLLSFIVPPIEQTLSRSFGLLVLWSCDKLLTLPFTCAIALESPIFNVIIKLIRMQICIENKYHSYSLMYKNLKLPRLAHSRSPCLIRMTVAVEPVNSVADPYVLSSPST